MTTWVRFDQNQGYFLEDISVFKENKKPTANVESYWGGNLELYIKINAAGNELIKIWRSFTFIRGTTGQATAGRPLFGIARELSNNVLYKFAVLYYN